MSSLVAQLRFVANPKDLTAFFASLAYCLKSVKNRRKIIDFGGNEIAGEKKFLWWMP